MRRTGNNLLFLLEVQNRIKRGESITLVTNKYPQYIEDNIESVTIQPLYNVQDENFNGFSERVDKKIIGYTLFK